MTQDEWDAAGFPKEEAGRCDSYKGVISIMAYDNEQINREILLHEIQHAIWFVSGLHFYPQAKKDQEEWSVAISSPMLLTVLQNNSKVLKYLVG
jgi:adenine specific DNA methylase Mod